jgi:glycolate oxidase FAD binding subunit
MAEIFAPQSPEEVCELIGDARAQGRTIAVRGRGSCALSGRTSAEWVLETGRLAGIVDYDPDELVITARAGTPLAEIEAALGERQQMLAFDPVPAAVALGERHTGATIGGIVASGSAGPRRLTAGAVRDHLLGFSAVSGRGEAFKAGGRVVKNVTGFDLPKLFAGSWGTLGILDTVTFRTLPAPRFEASLRLRVGLDQADSLMAAAMRHSAVVSCAAHSGEATLLRLEGFRPSVDARFEGLARDLADFGPVERVEGEESRRMWDGIRTLDLLPADAALWRISVPAADGIRVLAGLEELAVGWLVDWGGARLWLAVPDSGDAGATRVRGAAVEAGGHAVLLRASDGVRSAAGTSPRNPLIERLAERLKAAFDPGSILNPGLDIQEL